MGSDEVRAVEQLVEIETSATSAGSAVIIGSPSPEEAPEASATATSPAPASPESPVSQSVSVASEAPVAPRLPGMEDSDMNPADEARIVSWQSRKEFDRDPIYTAWKKDLRSLMRAGSWTWRQAAYILWASMPHPRIPKTESAFARDVLGLASARQIRKWKSGNQRGSRLREDIRKQSMEMLSHARADVIKALVLSAKKGDYKNYRDRELFLKLSGDYVPKSSLEVGPITEANAGATDISALREVAGNPGLEPSDEADAE